MKLRLTMEATITDLADVSLMPTPDTMKIEATQDLIDAWEAKEGKPLRETLIGEVNNDWPNTRVEIVVIE